MSLLLQPCSLARKVSTCEESSASVAGQPPSVSSSARTRRPFPRKSCLTSTSTRSSPQRTATVSAVLGRRSSNTRGQTGATGTGSSGNIHSSGSAACCGRWRRADHLLEPVLSGPAGRARSPAAFLGNLVSQRAVHANSIETRSSGPDAMVAGSLSSNCRCDTI